MGVFFHRHYIETDTHDRIIGGWSDGPFPDRDTNGAFCINNQGGYQFRLMPDGPENPRLYDPLGIPLYRWDGEKAIYRTESEISADRAAIPDPPPSAQEQLRADVDFLAAMQGVVL